MARSALKVSNTQRSEDRERKVEGVRGRGSASHPLNLSVGFGWGRSTAVSNRLAKRDAAELFLTTQT